MGIMKKYLILLVVVVFTISMLFMVISCRQPTNDGVHDGVPSWSSDSKMIAFESDRDDNWEIYVMSADGTAVTNLTNNPADDNAPSWSPDGKMIAFESDRDGNSDIYVMNTDGSSQKRLTK